MQAMGSHELSGNWATLILSWNSDDTLDEGRVGAEIDTLIGIGVDGIYSNGTAGEFHTQTEDEFDRISQLLAGKCNAAGMPFQIGVSHMSAQISRERLRRVTELRPSAIQVILPDWFPVTEEEAVSFMDTMAGTAGDIGLVLYNPPHAKRVLKPDEIGRLVERIPSLIGIKTAGGDDAWYASMREHIPKLSVFVPGHLLASGIMRGAKGAYSNVACLNPLAAQKWTRQISEDMKGALEIEGRLCLFMKKYIMPFISEQGYCNAACDRFMALIGGWADIGEKMRWPYRSIPMREGVRIRPLASEIIPEFVQ